jgi:hypothetical protein
VAQEQPQTPGNPTALYVDRSTPIVYQVDNKNAAILAWICPGSHNSMLFTRLVLCHFAEQGIGKHISLLPTALTLNP